MMNWICLYICGTENCAVPLVLLPTNSRLTASCVGGERHSHAACMGTRLDLQPDLNCKCVYSGCVLVVRGDGVHHHAVAKFHL